MLLTPESSRGRPVKKALGEKLKVGVDVETQVSLGAGGWRGKGSHGSEREERLVAESDHHMKFAEGRYIIYR